MGSGKSKWVSPREELRTHGDSHTSVSHRWPERQHTCSHLLPPTELCAHARWTGLPFCANCICFAFILSKHHVKAVNYERQKWVISPKTKLMPAPSPALLTTTNIFSIPVAGLVCPFCLDSTYKWNHSVFVFLYLTYFTYPNTLKSYPCCHKGQDSILFMAEK